MSGNPSVRTFAVFLLWGASLGGALLVGGACEEDPALVSTPLRPEANPSEYTGLTVRLPVDDDAAIDACRRKLARYLATVHWRVAV